MKLYRAVTILCILTMLLSPAAVLAGDGDPPPEESTFDDPLAWLLLALTQDGSAPPFPVDENGNLDISRWTYLGDTREWVAGLHMELPGGIDVGIATLYHWYRDDAGYYYAVPSNFTALYDLLTGDLPYLEHVVGSEMNGVWALLNLLSGALDGYDVDQASTLRGIMSKIQSILDRAGEEGEDALFPQLALLTALLKTLAADASFWLHLNIRLWQEGGTIPFVNPSNISQLVIVYDKSMALPPDLTGGPGSPAPGPLDPPGPPDPPPGPGPMPGAVTEEPTMHIHFGVEVLNPVVVAQDPEQRGADIFLTVQVPPVIYTYELEQQEARCIQSDTPPPDWDGCDLDTDGDGSPDHPGDPHWNEGSRSVWVTRQLAVPDRVVLAQGTWQFRAILSGESRGWILGELRAHYPNAVVVHPEWDLTATEYFELTDTYIDGDQQAIVRMQATYVRFVDPGVYDVVAFFRTTGTEFRCPGTCRNVRVTLGGRTVATTRTEPRLLEAHRDLKVWMHDARLVQ